MGHRFRRGKRAGTVGDEVVKRTASSTMADDKGCYLIAPECARRHMTVTQHPATITSVDH